jgi:hypothetical protein
MRKGSHQTQQIDKRRLPRSQSVKDKIGKGNKGKTRSEAVKQNLREKRLGTSASKETIKKLQKIRKGKPKSLEHRAAISQSLGDGRLILLRNDIWYGGVKYPEDKRKIYCEKWTPELRERIRAYWGYKSPLSEKTADDNMGRALDCHHVYFQKKACCQWDEDTQGYYAWVDRKKYYIRGDPNKFVPLTCEEHSMMKFNKLYWIKYFEDLIESQGGKSYFTNEEMRQFILKNDKFSQNKDLISKPI